MNLLGIEELQYKHEDLVLNVLTNKNIEVWMPFLHKLCGKRYYQIKAIETALKYLLSDKYSNIYDLVYENYKNNAYLRTRYLSIEDYKDKLQLKNKLFANLDLATGTGKSYVIFGIAKIMLSMNVVDRVLILCPSITIEKELKNKFTLLNQDESLLNTISEDYVNNIHHEIVDGNQTIKNNQICIENIHSIYQNTGSSIVDSFINNGHRTLVLNDESHHIFNKPTSGLNIPKEIKKWKEFLLNEKYNFKYMLGFTGTAFIGNEYFNDVIYRYSLRDAIENKFVKDIDYVQKDVTEDEYEKFQKIYHNHIAQKTKYNKVKPLSIIVTNTISNAENLCNELLNFLSKETNEIEKPIDHNKVIVVTSSNKHKNYVDLLKTVDDPNNPVEWIISVSMLTEGWDVKNVFQIVPWIDRAFNSKLLIAQVLGRGLRIPDQYKYTQPSVMVFNHDAWSKNIKYLVDEILDIRTRIFSNIILNGERSKYNFNVYNIDYKLEETETINNEVQKEFDYRRLEEEGIELISQDTEEKSLTEFETFSNNDYNLMQYDITEKSKEVTEIIKLLFDEFKGRGFEGKVMKFKDDKYDIDNLPPMELIINIVYKSMKNAGIKGTKLNYKNEMRVLNAFATILRNSNKTIKYIKKYSKPYLIETNNMSYESMNIANLKKGYHLFHSNQLEKEIKSKDVKRTIDDLYNKYYKKLPIGALNLKDTIRFKTPLDIIISSSNPEKQFINLLLSDNIKNNIDSWVKSRNKNFYSIEYNVRMGDERSKTREYIRREFNPDFFIKCSRSNIVYIIVIEIKIDNDDCKENKAKYRYSKEHFNILNKELNKNNINQIYKFHFLGPDDYNKFSKLLQNGELFKENNNYKSKLDILLEQ